MLQQYAHPMSVTLLLLVQLWSVVAAAAFGELEVVRPTDTSKQSNSQSRAIPGSQEKHRQPSERSLQEVNALQVYTIAMIDADIRMEIKDVASELSKYDMFTFERVCNEFLDSYMRFTPDCIIEDQLLMQDDLALYLDLKISTPDDKGNMEPDEFAQGLEWVFKSVGEDFVEALAAEQGMFSDVRIIDASAYMASSEAAAAAAEDGSSGGKSHIHAGIYLAIGAGVTLSIVLAVGMSVLLLLRKRETRLEKKAVEDDDIEEFQDANSSQPQTEPMSFGDGDDTFFTVSDGGSRMHGWPTERFGEEQVDDVSPLSNDDDKRRMEVANTRMDPVSPLSGMSRIRASPFPASENSSTAVSRDQRSAHLGAAQEIRPLSPPTESLSMRRTRETRFAFKGPRQPQPAPPASAGPCDGALLPMARPSESQSDESLTLDSYISFGPNAQRQLYREVSPAIPELKGSDDSDSLFPVEEEEDPSYQYRDHEIVRINRVSDSSDDEGMSAEVESLFMIDDDIVVEVDKGPERINRMQSMESIPLEEDDRPTKGAGNRRRSRRPTILQRFMKSDEVQRKASEFFEDPDRKAPYWITTRSSSSTSEDDGAMSNISDLSLRSVSSEEFSVIGISRKASTAESELDEALREEVQPQNRGFSEAEGITIKSMFPPRPKLAMKTRTLFSGALETPESSLPSTPTRPARTRHIAAGGPSMPTTPPRTRPPRPESGVPKPYSSKPSTPNRPPKNTFLYPTNEPSPMSSITVTPERLPKGTSLFNGALPSANSSLNTTPSSRQRAITPVRVKPLLGGSIPSTPSTTTHSTSETSSAGSHNSPVPPPSPSLFDRLTRGRSLFSGSVPSPTSVPSSRRSLNSDLYSVSVPEFDKL